MGSNGILFMDTEKVLISYNACVSKNILKKIFLSSCFKVYNYLWLSGHVKVSGWSQPLTSAKTFLLCSKDQLEVSDVQLGTLTNTFSQCLFQEKFILKPPR